MTAQSDPWRAQFDRQLASATKSVVISGAVLAFLAVFGLGADGLAITIAVVVVLSSAGAVLVARAGKPRGVMPLIVVGAVMTLPLGVVLALYGSRLRAAAAGKASAALPPVPSAESGAGRLIVDAPLSLFQTLLTKVIVTVDGRESRLAFTPHAVDLPAGEHHITLAVRGLGRRTSAPLAVNVTAGRVQVVSVKKGGLSGRITLNQGV